MSGYNGRRGPNVSQYVANLNTVSPPQDLLPDTGGYEEALDMFTNADFLDNNFDLTSPLDLGLDVDLSAGPQAHAAKTRHVTPNGEKQKMDFDLGDFQFADYSAFTNPLVDTSMPNLPQSQAPNYPVPPAFTSPVSSTVSPVTPGFDRSTGKKRKLDSIEADSEQYLDEGARNAAEEDKRRRNTAASARFRIKKKEREQLLEKTAKDMTERVNLLESRIQQLETENTWLKGLITEKNGGKASNSELAAMVLKKTEETANGRSNGSHTDGVGTKAESKKA
ncbi:hypothetical protein BDV95DRAFT_491566 [Massariosphaeria phaeospora]|uniref:BZIP domain-containing protein n=1 Tax=Massariosphaeria phaeospora TaxID=100035 RepID=A0A7C8IAT5_9PLEO|nr:hypothetical protein BDV95DRAFT_491566 [Massariosphaeria phaeospora]